jgi:SNF2 family DNA or RNA helicase
MKSPQIRDNAGQWHKAPYELPDRRPLMSHQVDGAKWLSGRKYSLLASEPGTGKTAQIIEAINALPDDSRVLIICPCSLRANWLRELSAWLRTPRQCRIARRYVPEVPIVIVHYDALRKFEVQLRRVHWALVAMDEAHLLKNPRSDRARQILGDEWTDSLEAERTILATATPVLNRPAELWPLLAILGTGMSEREFAMRFCSKEDPNACRDPEGLRALLAPLMLRQTKAECLKLPPKKRRILSVDTTADYLAAEETAERWHDECRKAGRFAGKVGWSRLAELRQKTALAKIAMPAVRAHLWEAVAQDRKLVVMAHHEAAIEAVRGLFAPGSAVAFNGQESQEQRGEAIRRFQGDPSCCVFVGSLGAAGTGITLTAARRMVVLEQCYTPALIEQAEDRIHRIGQKRAVLIEHIVVRNSIEARQLAIQLAKAETISSVL